MKEEEEKHNDLKFSIRKLGLKAIEFGSSQGNHTEEIKEILEKGCQVKEEAEIEREQKRIKKLKFKEKKNRQIGAPHHQAQIMKKRTHLLNQEDLLKVECSIHLIQEQMI
jgi:hypothetical protein